MKEKIKYEQWQDIQEKEWESLCRRCGECCGVTDGDPCEEVKYFEDGTFGCKVYENRFGDHQTKSGKTFRCVPIRDIIFKSWGGSQSCGYVKKLKG